MDRWTRIFQHWERRFAKNRLFSRRWLGTAIDWQWGHGFAIFFWTQRTYPYFSLLNKQSTVTAAPISQAKPADLHNVLASCAEGAGKVQTTQVPTKPRPAPLLPVDSQHPQHRYPERLTAVETLHSFSFVEQSDCCGFNQRCRISRRFSAVKVLKLRSPWQATWASSLYHQVFQLVETTIGVSHLRVKNKVASTPKAMWTAG